MIPSRTGGTEEFLSMFSTTKRKVGSGQLGILGMFPVLFFWMSPAFSNPSSAEEKSKTNVGTAALLDFLLEKEPENEFWLGLGADTYLDLTNGKWKESDRVLKHLGFRRMVIFHRDGRLSHEIVESRTPGAILLETISLPEVSSTVARSTSDESKLSQVISPAVIEYIKENRLYSFALDPP